MCLHSCFSSVADYCLLEIYCSENPASPIHNYSILYQCKDVIASLFQPSSLPNVISKRGVIPNSTSTMSIVQPALSIRSILTLIYGVKVCTIVLHPRLFTACVFIAGGTSFTAGSAAIVMILGSNGQLS